MDNQRSTISPEQLDQSWIVSRKGYDRHLNHEVHRKKTHKETVIAILHCHQQERPTVESLMNETNERTQLSFPKEMQHLPNALLKNGSIEKGIIRTSQYQVTREG